MGVIRTRLVSDTSARRQRAQSATFKGVLRCYAELNKEQYLLFLYNIIALF